MMCLVYSISNFYGMKHIVMLFLKSNVGVMPLNSFGLNQNLQDFQNNINELSESLFA